jgi:phosphate acetyltransferase
LIIDKYKRLEEQFDFVLVEGTSFSEGTVIELDMNVLIAKTLGFQRLLWVGWKTLEELVDSLFLAYDSLKLKMSKCWQLLPKSNSKIKLVTDGLRSSLPTETLVNAILVSSLNNPTIKIVDELDAKVLFGAEFK